MKKNKEILQQVEKDRQELRLLYFVKLTDKPIDEIQACGHGQSSGSKGDETSRSGLAEPSSGPRAQDRVEDIKAKVHEELSRTFGSAEFPARPAGSASGTTSGTTMHRTVERM